jgi:hypothetical protein
MCINVNIVHGNAGSPMIDTIPGPLHIPEETARLRHNFAAPAREIR